jgi:hypothetical protein
MTHKLGQIHFYRLPDFEEIKQRNGRRYHFYAVHAFPDLLKLRSVLPAF